MNNYAITIGINDYLTPENRGLKNLRGAINDAVEFEKWVTDTTGGKVAKENSYLIVSKAAPLAPIKEEIDNAFVSILTKVIENDSQADRLYVYFAGHGLGTVGGGIDTALCLPKWSQIQINNALSSWNYNDILRQYGFFKEIMFFIDCCRNTRISVRPQWPSFAPTAEGNISNTQFFIGYAAKFQNQSFEFDDEELEARGIFTKVLMEGLAGAAADENGKIPVKGLKDYLELKVPILAKERGLPIQEPEIMHNFSSDKIVGQLDSFPTEVKCRIIFKDERNAPVDLISNLGIIETFNSAEKKEIEISLKKGLYVLEDKVSNEEKSIRIDNLKENYEIIF